MFDISATILGGTFILGALYFHSHTILQYITRFIYFKQSAATTLTKCRKSSDVYALDYMFKGKKYTILLRIRKGPRRIIRVEDPDGVDVSDLVLPLMGPNQDFHTDLEVADDVFDHVYIAMDGTRMGIRDLL